MWFAVLLLITMQEPFGEPIMRLNQPFATEIDCLNRLDIIRHEFSPYIKSDKFPALECQYFADEEKVAL